ncbi:MAG: hypothetical protein ACT4PW_07875 [Acidimicrobiia bacterium]
MTLTDFTKKLTAVAVAAVGIVTLAAPAGAAGGANYDTNRDGKPDARIGTVDTDGNRTEDAGHIDTNRNGKIDAGDWLGKCPNGQRARLKATPGINGLRVELFCGQGKQPVDAVVIMDLNGDGDTADAGEVRPG